MRPGDLNYLPESRTTRSSLPRIQEHGFSLFRKAIEGGRMLNMTLVITLAILCLLAVVVSARVRHARLKNQKRQPTSESSTDVRDLLDRDDVLLVDTETTGLGDKAEVIEIAAIDTVGNLRLSVLSMPEGRISSGASRVNGLTRETLKAEGARPWPELHEQVKSVLESASIVAAWNAPFDVRMLNQTTERHGLSNIRVEIADLLRAYRRFRPDGRHRLVDAVKREGAKWSGESHRAEADCRAMLAVLREIA